MSPAEGAARHADAAGPETHSHAAMRASGAVDLNPVVEALPPRLVYSVFRTVSGSLLSAGGSGAWAACAIIGTLHRRGRSRQVLGSPRGSSRDVLAAGAPIRYTSRGPTLGPRRHSPGHDGCRRRPPVLGHQPAPPRPRPDARRSGIGRRRGPNGHEYVACQAQAAGIGFGKEGNCLLSLLLWTPPCFVSSSPVPTDSPGDFGDCEQEWRHGTHSPFRVDRRRAPACAEACQDPRTDYAG